VTPATKAIAALFTFTPYAGKSWGGNGTAGGVYLFNAACGSNSIYDSSKAYQINPKVLLANLQKESSGITRTTRPGVAIMGDAGTTWKDQISQAAKLRRRGFCTCRGHRLVRSNGKFMP
jgi:hypothetical protein